MALDREVWAIAFGLNARGATGIILAGVGLTNGLIDARIFVAMVFMAAVTSLMAGPMMSRLLEGRGIVTDVAHGLRTGPRPRR
jgi:Kef-type K+ transport system membrane component KefB